jgi:hypothetical protein
MRDRRAVSISRPVITAGSAVNRFIPPRMHSHTRMRVPEQPLGLLLLPFYGLFCERDCIVVCSAVGRTARQIRRRESRLINNSQLRMLI